MTLDEIDKALADWQSRISLASANLLELDDLFAYKRLIGGDGTTPAQLTGVTKTRVEPALQSIRELWQYLQLLQDVVKRADTMRRNMPRLWGVDNACRDIEKLLTDASIKMTTVQTPLALRGLLSASEQQAWATPQELLDLMTNTFERSKDTILDVDNAWKRLEPTLDAATQKIARLQSLAESLGVGALPELAAAQQQIQSLLTLVDTDPLGVNIDLDSQITPQLSQVSARLEELKTRYSQVQTDLQSAHTLLQQLQETNRQCIAAWNDCRQKVQTSALQPPLAQSTLTELETWLSTLESTLKQGQWKPASVGLKRWQASAQSALDTERASLNANSTPIETCAELRGRLSSLRVKARAYAARGAAIDPDLAAIAADAEQALNSRPVALDRASTLVAQYEARLTRCLEARQ